MAQMISEDRRIIPQVDPYAFWANEGNAGAQLEAVIVGRIVERRYQPEGDLTAKPICFALADSRKRMRPHRDSIKPQSPGCDQCRRNKWRLTRGRWQRACREYRRLAVIVPFALDEIRVLRVPPASLKAWRNYTMRTLSAVNKRYFEVITMLRLNDEVDFVSLKFTLSREPVPPKIRSRIGELRAKAVDILFEV